MSTAPLKQAARHALVISFCLHALSASAKDFSEREFRSQPLGHGVYELAYDRGQKALYAASAPSFDKHKTAGVVFRLAADSLRIDEKIASERRAFALSLDEENHILYLGNALDGSLTLLDTQTNRVIKTLQLSDDSAPEKQAHVREVVLDKLNQRLYVSGIGRKGQGLLWVVDTRKQQLIDTLKNIDPVGFAVDTSGEKVYAVTGNGELVTLDGKTSKLLSRVKVDPAESEHYFLNIALNSAAGVGYIADTNTRDVLVVRLDSGKLVDRIASPNSIAVLYHAGRDEIYVTHRNDRSISIIDAKTNRLKHTIKTTAMPNSLVLSADGGTLYASVKQDEKSDLDDYVLKIDLTQF